MSLVETLVALALLGLGILMAGSVVLWAAKVEERAGRRASALAFAAGIAEQLRGTPYSWVKAGVLDLSEELSPPGLESPSVELEVSEDEELGLKHVRILVSWEGKESGRFILETALGRAEIYR